MVEFEISNKFSIGFIGKSNVYVCHVILVMDGV